MVDELLAYNKKFVEEKGYEPHLTDKYPSKKIAILTCMDTRLVTLLPAALGLKNGDVKMIKNAGAVVDNPFDSTIRSILIAVYELGVQEVMVIGHTTCGVQGMDAKEMQHLMIERGISEETINTLKHSGIDLDKWLQGFEETDSAILKTVDLIKNHPLLPADITVRGYIMDSVTGEIREL